MFERGHRFYRSFVEAFSGDANGVLDALGIGEGNETRANRHDPIVGE